MPDLITHYIFAKEVLNKTEKQQTIEKYRGNYDLGCNGPDYFFYYHILPWQKDNMKEELHAYGNQLHNLNINEFFKKALIYVKNHYTESLYAYFIGYLTHYFLDRKAHPYIFYLSGVQTENEKTKIYKYYHKRFEVCIDERMLIEKEKTDIFHFHPAKIIRPNEMNIESIYSFVNTTLEAVYQHSISFKQFKDCINDFHLDLVLLYSKKKWKKRLMEWIEKTFHLDPFISTAMYSIKKENIDYLNLRHQKWYDPCFKKESTCSFLDLYDEALKEVLDFIQMFNDYLENQRELDDLLMVIDGRCFDSGQKEGVPLKFSECVYENEDMLRE